MYKYKKEAKHDGAFCLYKCIWFETWYHK